MSLPGWRLQTPEAREVVDHLALAELHLLFPVGSASGGLVRVREVRNGQVIGERGMAFEPGSLEVPPEVLAWVQGLLAAKAVVPADATRATVEVTAPTPPDKKPADGGFGSLR